MFYTFNYRCSKGTLTLITIGDLGKPPIKLSEPRDIGQICSCCNEKIIMKAGNYYLLDNKDTELILMN